MTKQKKMKKDDEHGRFVFYQRDAEEEHHEPGLDASVEDILDAPIDED